MLGSVLIASTSLDESTNTVLLELNRLGLPTLRLDTESFPFDAELSAEFSGSPRLSWGADHPSEQLRSIWYRRVRTPERPSDMNPGVYDFCIRESRSTLLGMLLTASVPIMSPPAAVWAAENKCYQLARARDVGLPIPRTLITNSPAAIRSAFNTFPRGMVIKPARSGFVDYGPEQHAIYTNRFLAEHLEHVDAARLCPAIYQEFLEKDCDIRVTIVGKRIFVAEIDSQSDPEATVDWRHTTRPDLPHRPGVLSTEIESGLLALCDALGLVFGAIDLVRTKDGRTIFLEINPNGQWLWLEDQLGFPISKAVAHWLASR